MKITHVHESVCLVYESKTPLTMQVPGLIGECTACWNELQVGPPVFFGVSVLAAVH